MGRWGYFVSIEGMEGSGKTTLAEGLRDFLLSQDLEVVFTREPGGTEEAEAIRKILLERTLSLDPWAEVFLFLAARRENVIRVIYPALRTGKVVITDRFSDSTFAYQGFGRGLPLRVLSRLNKLATLHLVPNLTFLVDLLSEEGFERIRSRERDRFEEEDSEFYERIRDGYLTLARRAKKRFVVLDGRMSKETLLESTREVILKRLISRGLLKEAEVR